MAQRFNDAVASATEKLEKGLITQPEFEHIVKKSRELAAELEDDDILHVYVFAQAYLPPDARTTPPPARTLTSRALPPYNCPRPPPTPLQAKFGHRADADHDAC